MNKAVWKVRPVDVRRMAANADEPERQRKLLALADALESRDVDLEVSTGGRDASVEHASTRR